MRLTLRTLLAYLDNTLDPADAETLKAKLTDSGFATSLVQRIRQKLDDRSLNAPSPDAVGPIDDANAISEYLDSTLPVEQIAEIERACLESDVHLAEAAACHQILSMALKTKAEVPAELRQRIYDLPDREIERIAASGQPFSSLAIDDAPPPAFADDPGVNPGLLDGDLPTRDQPATRATNPPAFAGSGVAGSGVAVSGAVPPVGPADSGVSDAPTRIRQTDSALATAAASSGPAIAGSRARSIQDDVIYAGQVRPSRITPWLVALAVAGGLLFLLAQIFQPLLRSGDSVADADLIGNESVVADAEPVTPNLEPSDNEPSDGETITEFAEAIPAGDGVPESIAAPEVIDGGPDNLLVAPEPDGEPEMDSLPSPTPTAADAVADTVVDDVADDAIQVMPMPEPETDASSQAKEDVAMAAADPSTADPEVTDAVPPAGDKPASEIARVTGDTTLIAAQQPDGSWVRLKRDMTVMPTTPIFVAPSFRASMTTESGFDLTFIGPARARLVDEGAGQSRVVMDYGRMLVSAGQPDQTLPMTLGGLESSIRFSDVETVAAASLKHFRGAGTNPLVPENRVQLVGVLSVQGTFDLNVDGKTESLTTGKQWIRRGDKAATISPLEAIPDWIDAPDPSTPSLRTTAREGLLELIDDEKELEILLREATLFRRSEVAALAAESLLFIGRGDIYFGSDGILCEPRQRAYWPDHYADLTSTVDQSAESAKQLQEAIKKMDSVGAAVLFKLLTGYSQQQLSQGGDAELVALLDSESMAVRVLAIENLQRITGTSLYYRPEQETAARRAAAIKKWEVRLRKGDIRWTE